VDASVFLHLKCDVAETRYTAKPTALENLFSYRRAARLRPAAKGS
jgi:hypothetical protein